MAVIGTFGTYTAARLAIYSSQRSMQVTGNNIGNINTTGYTRQRADICSMYSVGTPRYQNSYNMNVGYGAMVSNVSQLRDPFLDIRFRNENASLGYHEAMQEGLNQISHILDEVGRGNQGFGIIEAQLGDFKNTLEDLLEHPGSTTHDDLVAASASTLCSLLNSAAKELQQVRDNEAMRLEESMGDVNRILDNIRDLNEQIRTQSVYGGNALELRDARNLEIDKLSKYMKINVTYSMEKIDAKTEIEKLTITLADAKTQDPITGQYKDITLVDGIYATQFMMDDTMPKENPLYDPTKPQGMQYWNAAAGRPTNSIYEAVELNKDWDETGLTFPYGTKLVDKLDENNNPVLDDQGNKVQVAVIDEDSPNVGYYRYKAAAPAPGVTDDEIVQITVDGVTGYYTNNIEKANITKNDATNNPNADTRYDPLSPVGYKYLASKSSVPADQINVATNGGQSDFLVMQPSDENGTPIDQYYTNVAANGIQLDNFKTGSNEDRYLFKLDALRDKKDHIMYEGTAKESLEVQLGDNDLFGSVQALRELLTEEGEFASGEDIDRDPNAATKRGIPYYQHMLDSFAQKFAAEMNKANHLQADAAKEAYKTTDVVTDPNTTPPTTIKCFVDQNDDPIIKTNVPDPLQHDYDKFMTADDLEVEANLERLWNQGVVRTDSPEWKHYDGGPLFSNRGDGDVTTGITAENISVSYSWAHGAVRVLNTQKGNTQYIDENGETKYQDGKTRNDNIAHIISMVNSDMSYMAHDTVADAVVSSTPFFTGNFQQMFGNATSTLGADSQTTNALYSNFNLTTMSLDNDRISVSGVDLNEEATNMMQFSQSFAAACKLLTTIDEMLDRLINNTI